MTLHNLPLESITPSVNNPRKHFDQTAQDELAASVKKFGVMQPIIVRPDGKPSTFRGYELVCGERRYRAALQAGLREIPAIVRELSDDEAFDLQITENLQRKDINPMEESDAFHALTKRGKTSAAQIAKRFGKSEKYVYDRLALQRCILSVQDGVRSGDLPLKHAKQFAQLNMDDQQALYDACIKRGTVDTSDIKDIISRQFSYVLDEAPFNIKNPNLVPSAGACTKCPKRSGCNQLLFEDVDSKDICFDKTCYDKKVEAHIEHRIKELQDAGMTVHRISCRYSTELEGVIDRSDWDEIGKDEDGYENCKTVGIVVEVRDYGTIEDKIGDVLKIEVAEPETEDEDEQTDAKGDFIGGPINASLVNGTGSSRRYVDHEEEVTKYITVRLAPLLFERPDDFDEEGVVRDYFRSVFYSLNEDVAQHLCDTVGWQKCMHDDEFLQKDTSEALKNSLDYSSIRKGIVLIKAVDKANDAVCGLEFSTDEPEAEETIPAIKEFERIGIDFIALVKEYEQETGHKFD